MPTTCCSRTRSRTSPWPATGQGALAPAERPRQGGQVPRGRDRAGDALPPPRAARDELPAGARAVLPDRPGERPSSQARPGDLFPARAPDVRGLPRELTRRSRAPDRARLGVAVAAGAGVWGLNGGAEPGGRRPASPTA